MSEDKKTNQDRKPSLTPTLANLKDVEKRFFEKFGR